MNKAQKFVEKLTITANMTIEQVMHIIDDGMCKTAFLIKDGKLKGSISDGDVRRHLLNGGSIKDNVSPIINYNPKYILEKESDINCKAYMTVNLISALPVVNSDGIVVRIEVINENQEYRKIKNVLVILMAGGMGTRLKPYTEIIPKPLIPIGDKTITEQILDRFELYSINDFYMIINYKKSLIEAYFKDINKYKRLHFVEEEDFLGTAGGIKLVEDIAESDFFVVNCDIIIDDDYYDIYREHKDNNNTITIVSAKKKIKVPYGTILSDKDGLVTELVEKPELVYCINTGMYLCSAKIKEYIDDNEKIDMPNLIERCIKSGERVGQYVISENKWYDMGQPNELERMKNKFGY